MTSPARGGLAARVAVQLGLAALAVAGCAPPPPAAVTAAPVPVARPAPAAAVEPAAVRIPALDVASPLVELRTDDAGVLVPPATADVAGWYTAGPAPGEPGPAIVAGHVDSRLGPGVFLDLARLRPGDVVEVDRVDGSVLRFVVRAVDTVAKDAFPTAAVYGPTPVPELRLITCGGEFDAATGHYRANVIVHATLDAPGGWTFGD